MGHPETAGTSEKKSVILPSVIILLIILAWAQLRGEEKNVNNDPDRESAASEDAADLKSVMTIESIVVIGERPLSAASDQIVRNRDFMNFPRRTASDLMRFVPGLHITQHTGGAKAHQIFLRGFDAEHGQDIAAFIDGIPLNESSHVHGQGYLDLHFIIPEAIEKIWIMKGPYDSRFGNFATAGVINFIPCTKKDHRFSVSAEGGSYMTGGIFGDVYGSLQGLDIYTAVSAERSEGYTDPGAMKNGKVFFSSSYPLSRNTEVRLLYAGYSARSDAADIVPVSCVDSGEISLFGSFDGSNGVDADRHLLGVTVSMTGRKQSGELKAYYNNKMTDIFSNYTYYYFNQDNGDQLEQYDRRHYYGMKGHYRLISKAWNAVISSEAGFSLRNDTVDQAQTNTCQRRPYNLLNRYEFNETAAGFYVHERVIMTRWLELIGGLRYDIIRYSGEGTQDRQVLDIYTNGVITDEDVPVDFDEYADGFSPSLSVIISVTENITLFMNYGRGFVSTQARQTAWKSDRDLPAVDGAEAGTRLKLFSKRVDLSGSVWLADKEKEYVFDSERAGTVEREASRRTGVDLELRYAPWGWIYLSTDLTYTRARFRDSGEQVPNMGEWIMTNMLSVMHPAGFSFASRGRYVGERVHDNGFRSGDYYIVDMLAGYRYGPFSVTLSVENLFDTAWYDSVFAYTSRPEKNGDELTGLHVTPGNPRIFKVKCEYVF